MYLSLQDFVDNVLEQRKKEQNVNAKYVLGPRIVSNI